MTMKTTGIERLAANRGWNHFFGFGSSTFLIPCR